LGKIKREKVIKGNKTTKHKTESPHTTAPPITPQTKQKKKINPQNTNKTPLKKEKNTQITKKTPKKREKQASKGNHFKAYEGKKGGNEKRPVDDLSNIRKNLFCRSGAPRSMS